MDLDSEAVVRTCRREGISLLILFGSRAAGRAGAKSDVDVAALFEGSPASLTEQVRLQRRLGEALGATGEIDLVILNTTRSTTLRREIARNGRAVFDKDGEQFIQFVTRAMRDFADFAGFRRLRREALEKGAGA